jgi:hypothetical protein
MTSRWHWITALLFLAGSTVSAQESDSHIRLGDQGGQTRPPNDLAQQLAKQLLTRPPQGSGLEPERLNELLNKLEKTKGLNTPEKRREFLNNNRDLEKLLSRINEHDPEFQRQMQNRLQPPPDPRKATQRESLRNLVKDFQEDMRKKRESQSSSFVPNSRSPDSGFNPDNVGREPRSQASNPSTPDRMPSNSQQTGPSKRPNVDLSERNHQPSRGESELLRKLERSLPKSMDKSPAMQRLVDDLSNKDFSKSASSRFWKEGKLPDVNWERMGRNMDRTGNFLDRNLSGMGRTNLPNAPHLDGPDLPRGPQMAGMGGAPSGGDVLELGKAGSIIVTILALLIGGFVLWRFLLKPLSQVRLKPAENGTGDWPVNPWLIRTREELVKAFDYLALLKCGVPAKMWHHHEVADHLAEEAQRPHADNLANVYEQARYSPPPETIPEPVMDRARQDLCLLAGVAAP